MTAEAKFRIGDPVRIIGGHEHLFDQVGTIVSFHPVGTKYRYNVAVDGMDNLRFKDSELQFPTAPAGPPDLDKIQRGIGDALTGAGTIKDDARIVHWDIRKVWADNVPGANLTITQEQT